MPQQQRKPRQQRKRLPRRPPKTCVDPAVWKAYLVKLAAAYINAADIYDEVQARLDEEIHETLAARAARVNNEGPAGQIDCLLDERWSVEEIERLLKGETP